MADMTGGKIIWAQDEAGEIGKRPAMDRGTFEIDGASYLSLPLLGQGRAKR